MSLGEKPTVVDLFAGAGGFGLGFHSAGFRTLSSLEIDEWACLTLKENNISENIITADIEEIDSKNFKSHFGDIEPDVVIGGPPCQGFSKCKKDSGDPKDPRNSLFRDFLRVALLLNPKVIIIENVPEIDEAKTDQGELVLAVIERELLDSGYDYVASKVLMAVDYGVPQIRERLFIVASRVGEIGFPEPTHSTGESSELRTTPTLWEAISDLPQIEAKQGEEKSTYSEAPTSEFQQLMRQDCKVLYNHVAMKHYPRTVERFKAMGWGTKVADLPKHLHPKKRNSDEYSEIIYDQNNRRMHPDFPCHTIPASFYANFVHPYCHRNFTAREGARIQSFPDWYRFMGKPTVPSRRLLEREGRIGDLKLCQYNQIGNAVPPLMAKSIAKVVMTRLGESGDYEREARQAQVLATLD